MPKVTPEYESAKRTAILDAARICFARNGFHATTMADVISAGGLSASAVYRLFPGKADLARAVVGEVIERVSQHSAERLGGLAVESPEALLAALADLAADPPATPTDRAVALHAWAEAQRDPALGAEIRDQYLAAETWIRTRLQASAIGRSMEATRLDRLTRLVLSTLPGSYVVEAVLH